MSDWIVVARAEDFAPGGVRTLYIDGTPIAVFNLGGRFHAIEDLCSHEAETLSDGELVGDEIICPRHGARFSVVTGEALSPPAYEPVATFAVKVEAGVVMVKDDRWD
jgi:3-phenylpropionate/trans-cinnamate dioxygenase ferredoxin subunit